MVDINYYFVKLQEKLSVLAPRLHDKSMLLLPRNTTIPLTLRKQDSSRDLLR